MSFRKSGKSACEGVVISQAFLYKKNDVIVEKVQLNFSDVPKELEKWKNAIEKSKSEIKELKGKLKSKVTPDELEILTAHIMMLDDPMFIKDIENKIKKEAINAEYVVKEVSEKYIQLFNKIKDPLYAQRAIDIKDISERIILNLIEKDLRRERLDYKIIFAKEILPSQLLKAVEAGVHINGLVFEYGGKHLMLLF